jgi:hypothetical protein
VSDPYKRAGQIRHDLRRIRDHYDDALDGGQSTDESEVRAKTDAGEPVALAAIDARAGAHRDLMYWSRFILDEVNQGTIVHGPAFVTVEALAVFVDIWSLALCEQHPLDGDNLAKEVAKHAKLLEALAKGWQRKRIMIGACPEQILVVEDGFETFIHCTGTLHAVMDENDEGLLPTNVTCDATRDHQWSPWQWRDLGHRIGSFIA